VTRFAPDRGTGASRPDAKFARLRAAGRVWAIAVIHGEERRLAQLHDTISERFQAGDRVVYLGNYVGPGGAVLATIDELLDFRRRVLGRPGGGACDVVFLRGAREEIWQKLLQLQFSPNPGGLLDWMVRAGMEPTIRAYGGDLRQGFAACRDGARAITRWTGALLGAMNATPGHTALFAALRHAAFTEDCSLLFVHAAIEPSQPLSEQRDAFWWGREDILELKEPFAGFRRVVRGVDRHRRGVVERELAVSIDGGAGQGGRLNAACFGLDGALVDKAEA
jgi:serine/threonine protein phosphatase 1